MQDSAEGSVEGVGGVLAGSSIMAKEDGSVNEGMLDFGGGRSPLTKGRNVQAMTITD
jgi:hypothetical protein